MTKNIDLKSYIRNIHDWPQKGIIFRDITPLLADPVAFDAAADLLCDNYYGRDIDFVAAVDARGFILGSVVANKLGIGFVPIRKKGKLPFTIESHDYDLEYGTNTLEVHIDAVHSGSKVLMIDDLLATGGTMAASCKLVEKIGGEIVGISFLIELTDLNGREVLKDYDIKSIVKF